MVKRIIGSAVRALLMAFLMAVPSLVLPGTSSDAAQLAALVALVAAVVTFAEYNSEYPTFLEFRNAPPFNRLRFLALFFCVWFASLLIASEARDPALPPTLLEFGSQCEVNAGLPVLTGPPHIHYLRRFACAF